MKYRITIEKIDIKKVMRETWYPNLTNKKGEEGAYADTAFDEEKSQSIYEQTRESEIDLMAVINAFNKETI